MGLLQTLFGAPGQTNPSEISSLQSPFLQDLFSRAQDFSQGPSLSPLEQQGQQQQLGVAENLSPFIQGAQGAGQFLTSTDLLSPQSNPFLAAQGQAAIRPLFQQLTESILPSIRSGAINAGQFGSNRQGIAEGIASRGALQTAGDTLSNLFSGAYGQGLNALQGGLQLAPQTAALGLLPGQIMQQVGQDQRLAPFNQLQNLQSLIGPPVVTGGGGTTAQQGIVSLNLGGKF